MRPVPISRGTRLSRGARVHRAIRAGILALTVTMMPALLLAGRTTDPARWSMIVMVGWLVAWVALCVALLLFRCPQCGRPFHRMSGVLSAFNTRCLHCDVALRPGSGRR